jgi:hypothetical protein
MAAASFLSAIVLAGALALGACTEKAEEPAAPLAQSPDTPDTPVANAAGPANADPPQLASPVGPATPEDCNAPKAEPFVGRRADSAIRAELLAAVAPVTAIRWVRPGDATTEDFSAQRLNVMLDVGGRIISAHCG